MWWKDKFRFRNRKTAIYQLKMCLFSIRAVVHRSHSPTVCARTCTCLLTYSSARLASSKIKIKISLCSKTFLRRDIDMIYEYVIMTTMTSHDTFQKYSKGSISVVNLYMFRQTRGSRLFSAAHIGTRTRLQGCFTETEKNCHLYFESTAAAAVLHSK